MVQALVQSRHPAIHSLFSPPNFIPWEIKMTVLKSVFQYSKHLLIGMQRGMRYTSCPQGAHSLFGEVGV